MTRHSSIRLGTRTSALARWQADWVADRLRKSGVEVELVLITTEGDVKQGPLGQIGGQGLFTKQIQQALLDERIDLAVHSLKDLPTEHAGGLALAAVPPRESAGDALVCNAFSTIQELQIRRGELMLPLGSWELEMTQINSIELSDRSMMSPAAA